MTSNRWSLRRAAAFGAVLSPVGLIAQNAIGNASFNGGTAHIIGIGIGGAVGGAILFMLVASIRNAFAS